MRRIGVYYRSAARSAARPCGARCFSGTDRVGCLSKQDQGGRFFSSPRAGVVQRRAFSAAVACDDGGGEAEWEAAFLEATREVRSSDSHAASAEAMRRLDKLGLLKHTDLRDRPERFFQAHRLLARHAVAHGPGFWIRFTVHHNLCYGTVVAVGSDAQVAALAARQERGELGCFALTEKLAGVQSGLVVETMAEYDHEAREFVLHTPSEGAAKNWISQGFTADNAVVLADLRVGGERKGPHAFLVPMRRQGRLTPGVMVGDMGLKTTGNDLDNAWIKFDRVRVDEGALLSKHCGIDDSGAYVLRKSADGTIPRPFEMIGQRLYTGRVAVAQAALAYRRQLFEVTQAYADAKPIPNVVDPATPKTLASIPQLRALFAEAEVAAVDLEAFVARCEARLAPLMRAGAVPDAALANDIATAKVKAVEVSIALCGRLKQEVGSYALMDSSGFKHLDFLNCCKFAEGDSRILAQKMARDTLRRLAKGKGALPPGASPEELRLARDLATALAPAKGDKVREAQLWDDHWTLVYDLAEASMAHTMQKARAEIK